MRDEKPNDGQRQRMGTSRNPLSICVPSYYIIWKNGKDKSRRRNQQKVNC